MSDKKKTNIGTSRLECNIVLINELPRSWRAKTKKVCVMKKNHLKSSTSFRTEYNKLRHFHSLTFPNEKKQLIINLFLPFLPCCPLQLLPTQYSKHVFLLLRLICFSRMLVNGIMWWDSVTLDHQRHSEMEQNPTDSPNSLEYHSDNGVQSWSQCKQGLIVDPPHWRSAQSTGCCFFMYLNESSDEMALTVSTLTPNLCNIDLYCYRISTP